MTFGYFAGVNIAILACITYFYFEFKDTIPVSKYYRTLNEGSSDESSVSSSVDSSVGSSVGSSDDDEKETEEV